MRRPLPVCLGLIGLFGFSCGGSDARQPADFLDLETLERDIRALSADSMLGRKAGTEGEERSADFLRGRFEEIGLEPVNGSYYQSVDLVGTKKDSVASSLEIRNSDGALDYVSDETLTYWSTSQKPEVKIQSAPLVFVGYGVQAPEYEWDDLKGQDLQGKVLLFLNNDPPVSEDGTELFGGEARTYYGRWTYKFEQAMRLGAVGAFMIHTTPSASYPFSVVQHSGAEEHFALDLPDTGYQVDLVGWLDEATSERIAQGLNTTLDGLFQMAERKDFQPADTGFRVSASIGTEIRRLQTRNVFGVLEGSDPALKEQVLVFSAHYDHLGVNEEVTGDDKIFNGAWDNASGTASILNLARAFVEAGQQPRRSLLFLACAAEESGSLGSQWFVSNPPFERSRIVGNINIDMPQIFGPTADLAVIGVDTNTMGDELREIALGYRVEGSDGTSKTVHVTGDPDPNAGSFYRSDQVNFAKAGIPALFLNPGKDYMPGLTFDPKVYEDGHYHQVSDQIDEHWNLLGLIRDLKIVADLTVRLAGADEIPRWHEGNEFEGEWKKLHGID